MTEQTTHQDAWQDAWGMPLSAAACTRCGWEFLVPGDGEWTCPHCFAARLAAYPGARNLPCQPEQVLPFTLSANGLDLSIRQFARGIPFAPADLTPEALRRRLTRLFLPRWLIDAQVAAEWQAEAGFRYAVLSHREQYSETVSNWQTEEVKETRTRWEPRLGRLRRAYANIPAPALDDPRLLDRLGGFAPASAQPYTPAGAQHSTIRVPDHTPDEAWSEAQAAFQAAAAEECRAASAADELRQFQWRARFQGLHWTLQLLPVYTTYYLDDHGTPQALLIHGQTGRIHGKRVPSLDRARGASIAFLLLGIILLLLGLILEAFAARVGGMAGLAGFLMIAGAGSALATFLPYLTVWDFRRKQENAD